MKLAHERAHPQYLPPVGVCLIEGVTDELRREP
jgi:hypothetical protein